MAKFPYRIRWRSILFNLPTIITLVFQLRAQWPVVRKAVEACVTENPEVVDLLKAVDDLLYILARKRR